jgi:hypothetical protein
MALQEYEHSNEVQVARYPIHTPVSNSLINLYTNEARPLDAIRTKAQDALQQKGRVHVRFFIGLPGNGKTQIISEQLAQDEALLLQTGYNPQNHLMLITWENAQRHTAKKIPLFRDVPPEKASFPQHSSQNFTFEKNIRGAINDAEKQGGGWVYVEAPGIARRGESAIHNILTDSPWGPKGQNITNDVILVIAGEKIVHSAEAIRQQYMNAATPEERLSALRALGVYPETGNYATVQVPGGPQNALIKLRNDAIDELARITNRTSEAELLKSDPQVLNHFLKTKGARYWARLLGAKEKDPYTPYDPQRKINFTAVSNAEPQENPVLYLDRLQTYDRTYPIIVM